jgi:eukaryotic-like serine/threonine-protein kinase
MVPTTHSEAVRQLPQTCFGEYQLSQPAWEHPLGVVWVAYKKSVTLVHEVSALNLVYGNVLPDEKSKRRYSEALRRLSRLQHPKLVSIREVVEHEGGIGVVSDGKHLISLRSLLVRNSENGDEVPVGVALRLVAECLQLLQSLEESTPNWADVQRIIFGGVGPDAFLLGANGEIQFAFQSVAAFLKASAQAARDPAFISYRSHEQVTPMTATADARSAVFSCGALMWEMLAGKPLPSPFTNSQTHVAMRGIAIVPRLDAPEIRTSKGVGPELVDWVARSLERAPAARFQSPAVMLRMLEELYGTYEVAGDAAMRTWVQSLVGEELAQRSEAIAALSGVDPATFDRVTVIPALATSPSPEKPAVEEPPTKPRQVSRPAIPQPRTVPTPLGKPGRTVPKPPNNKLPIPRPKLSSSPATRTPANFSNLQAKSPSFADATEQITKPQLQTIQPEALRTPLPVDPAPDSLLEPEMIEEVEAVEQAVPKPGPPPPRMAPPVIGTKPQPWEHEAPTKPRTVPPPVPVLAAINKALPVVEELPEPVQQEILTPPVAVAPVAVAEPPAEAVSTQVEGEPTAHRSRAELNAAESSSAHSLSDGPVVLAPPPSFPSGSSLMDDSTTFSAVEQDIAERHNQQHRRKLMMVVGAVMGSMVLLLLIVFVMKGSGGKSDSTLATPSQPTSKVTPATPKKSEEKPATGATSEPSTPPSASSNSVSPSDKDRPESGSGSDLGGGNASPRGSAAPTPWKKYLPKKI